MADMNEFNANLVNEFRSNGGALTGMFEHAPVLLLTHTGAKSGIKRTNPLVYTVDGDRLVIIASKGGAPADPHWFLNIVANPAVTVELPTETFEATASVVTGEERDRLFRAQAELMPNFDEYAQATTREIPVVVLTRS
jgi:deazaflavin-dependent oxidoreductase (nitroreductase family)